MTPSSAQMFEFLPSSVNDSTYHHVGGMSVLQHAQSTPDLRKIENPAKLLWPTDE
jgi:hypothetical protein